MANHNHNHNPSNKLYMTKEERLYKAQFIRIVLTMPEIVVINLKQERRHGAQIRLFSGCSWRTSPFSYSRF